jgi:hypothetical protein
MKSVEILLGPLVLIDGRLEIDVWHGTRAYLVGADPGPIPSLPECR